MVDQEARENFRRNLFSSVGELSDLEHQRATWHDPELNPHYTFVEFVECFYDIAGGDYDEGDPDADQAPLQGLLKDGYISNEERDAVWPLHLALTEYVGPGDQYEPFILEDPAWHAVVAVASQAKAQLQSLPSTSNERAYFSNALPPASQKRRP